MPPGSVDDDGSDESDESEVTEADAVTGDVKGENRPKDPVLFLFDVLDRLLQTVDALYAKCEELPGRIKFGLGAISFLSSIYLGATIRWALNSTFGAAISSLIGDLAAFSPGIQVALLLLTLLVFQVTVVNEKLTDIGEVVEPEMNDSATSTDGGCQTRRFKKSSGGVFSGAALGAIFGALFGYTSTMFGGMIFGATIGDVIEDWIVRRKNRRKLKAKIVEYLLREHIFEPESVAAKIVRSWFPADDAAFVTEALEDLLADEDSPVIRSTNDGIQLTTPAKAVTYLDRNGGRVPPEFEGPNRPR